MQQILVIRLALTNIFTANKPLRSLEEVTRDIIELEDSSKGLIDEIPNSYISCYECFKNILHFFWQCVSNCIIFAYNRTHHASRRISAPRWVFDF